MNKKILLPLALLSVGAVVMLLPKKGGNSKGSAFSRDYLLQNDGKVFIDTTNNWFGVKNGKLYKFKEEAGYFAWQKDNGISFPEQVKLNFPLWQNWDYATFDSAVVFDYDY